MTESRESPQAGYTDADDGRTFAIDAARIAQDYKAEDIIILDLRGLSTLADFFVLGTGTSDRQMQTVLDKIKEHAKSIDRRPFNVADSPGGAWLLADYVDVVIHLFDADHRAYYDLDGLWGDAPEVAWEPDARESGHT